MDPRLSGIAEMVQADGEPVAAPAAPFADQVMTIAPDPPLAEPVKPSVPAVVDMGGVFTVNVNGAGDGGSVEDPSCAA